MPAWVASGSAEIQHEPGQLSESLIPMSSHLQLWQALCENHRAENVALCLGLATVVTDYFLEGHLLQLVHLHG